MYGVFNFFLYPPPLVLVPPYLFSLFNVRLPGDTPVLPPPIRICICLGRGINCVFRVLNVSITVYVTPAVVVVLVHSFKEMRTLTTTAEERCN